MSVKEPYQFMVGSRMARLSPSHKAETVHRDMANLTMEFLKYGNGPVAEAGQIVVAHYTGWLTNGQKFDSSVDRNEPFEVAAGVGQVIQGWDVALLRMRVGDKVKVTIPAEMGYGASGAGGVIPANATLIFEMELLEIRGR